MTSPLDSTNPHGIRVVADRAPVREDVKTAFAQGSDKATKAINSLIRPHQRRSTAPASVKHTK